ncbi:hypothetical protein Tco_1039933, partial [Tanacetum coccineum]
GKGQVRIVDILVNLTENDNIVAEHRLSSEITQSLDGSSDTSEGSKNSGSFEDSGRSYEEYSEDGVSSKEEGSETLQAYSEALSSKESIQWKKAIIEEMVSLKKNKTCSDEAIALPQDVSSTSDHHLIKLENQVQRLMKAHLALTQPTQVNKVTTLCEIYSGPHDTQYCMEDPEQAFVKYVSSCTDEVGEGLVFEFMASQAARLSKFEANFKRQQSEMTNKIDTVLKAIIDQIACTLPSDMVKNPKLGTHLVLVMFIKIIRDDDEPQNEGPNDGEGATIKEPVVEYFNTFSTRDELTYHKRKLDPRENANGGINNFTGRIKGMHVFMGNFTYVIDFMIVDDISSIIDLRLSQAVLGEPIVEISNMTHDPPEGVVRFIKGDDEVAYKMPHKIEQYDSLSDLEKSIPNQSILGTKKTREGVGSRRSDTRDNYHGEHYIMENIIIASKLMNHIFKLNRNGVCLPDDI